jgi:transcriptional regulator with XRE-family HTH domain
MREEREPGLNLTERVKRYVLEKSKTLAEIHKVTGVPRTTLGGWLKGEKSLTTTVFDRICQAYEISPVRLYDMPESGMSVPTLKELSTFSEGEKPTLMAALHKAINRAENTEQEMRSKMADELRRFAESTSFETYIHDELEKARPHLEAEFNALMNHSEFREEMEHLLERASDGNK